VNAFSKINFKAVQWGPTLLLHLLRSFSAGLIWAFVLLVANGGSSSGPSWWTMPFVLPFAYFVALPFYFLVAKVATAVAGDAIAFGVAMVALIFALGIVVGDPLVYILHKTKPAFVPTEKFNFVNFSIVLFVEAPSMVTA
jgi:hypothetical protein